MMVRRKFLAFLGLGILCAKARAQTAVLEAMPFSSLKAGAALPEWLKAYAFPNRPKHTEFALVEDEGRTVLRARSSASTSGLARALAVDPRRHPILAWRWKVMNLIARSDMASKAGDDFPARLYLSFEGNRRALCYVWDARQPAGTVVANPYSDRVQMVVAESGPAHLGRWRSHERDWVADYRRGFGAEPPRIEAVIVSADTDNTGETAESYFGDVSFKSRPTS
jgi:hypothetical protein